MKLQKAKSVLNQKRSTEQRIEDLSAEIRNLDQKAIVPDRSAEINSERLLIQETNSQIEELEVELKTHRDRIRSKIKALQEIQEQAGSRIAGIKREIEHAEAAAEDAVRAKSVKERALSELQKRLEAIEVNVPEAKAVIEQVRLRAIKEEELRMQIEAEVQAEVERLQKQGHTFQGDLKKFAERRAKELSRSYTGKGVALDSPQ